MTSPSFLDSCCEGTDFVYGHFDTFFDDFHSFEGKDSTKMLSLNFNFIKNIPRAFLQRYTPTALAKFIKVDRFLASFRYNHEKVCNILRE